MSKKTMSKKTKREPTRERKAKRETEGEAAGRVFCQRLQEPVPVEEHRKCAYCFGSVEAVIEGRHEEFCDYDPDRDPLQFGFPFK